MSAKPEALRSDLASSGRQVLRDIRDSLVRIEHAVDRLPSKGFLLFWIVGVPVAVLLALIALLSRF